jgi:hypothetical protein
MPAAPLLAYLAFSFQPGKDAVEIVLLDPHLRRNLGDRDPRLLLNDRKGFRGLLAAALPPSSCTLASGPCFRRGRSCFVADLEPRGTRPPTASGRPRRGEWSLIR